MLNKIKNIFTKKYSGISDESLPVNKWDYDELNLVSTSDPFRDVDVVDWNRNRRWQDGSGSCVAQTCAGMHDDILGSETSAVPIYSGRGNKPAAGMAYADVVKLLPTTKIYTESDVPSQSMTDQQMDSQVIRGNSVQGKLEAFSLPKSFDEVAKAVRQNGRASIWFRGTYDEWLKWVIDDLSSQSNQVRHSVRIVDAVRKDGVEYLVALDSAGYYRADQPKPNWILKDGIRLITRKAFEQGVFNQWTARQINNEQPFGKPKYTFNRNLKFGMLNDNDVKELQRCLIYEGLLDKDAVTGNYKNMTRSAVKAFQLKHKVAPVQEITQLAGMGCGPLTRKKLNELYA